MARLALGSRARAALLAAGVGALLAASACGGNEQAGGGRPGSANTAANVEAALLGRLEGKLLSVEWVRCLASGYERESEPVFRCNVNFGDPHIEAYCALIRDGELVTNVEEPALRCARERTAEGEPVG